MTVAASALAALLVLISETTAHCKSASTCPLTELWLYNGAAVQVVTGARTTKLATEKGSAVRAVGVEYTIGGPSGSRQTGACSQALFTNCTCFDMLTA